MSLYHASAMKKLPLTAQQAFRLLSPSITLMLRNLPSAPNSDVLKELIVSPLAVEKETSNKASWVTRMDLQNFDTVSTKVLYILATLRVYITTLLLEWRFSFLPLSRSLWQRSKTNVSHDGQTQLSSQLLVSEQSNAW